MASKRRLRRNACSRKVRFTCMEAAQAAARAARQRTSHAIRAYPCPHNCGGFHIGHY